MSMTTERHPLTEDALDRVKVGVAELDVATGNTVLSTSGLGSCIGVAVADPTADVAGLAHVMLPEPTGDDRDKPAKSVEVGIEALLSAVEANGGGPDGIEAKLAGGSQMFDFSGVGQAVGERNVERAREVLAARDVEIVAEDVGGSHGRSLELRPDTWTLTVSSAHDGVLKL